MMIGALLLTKSTDRRAVETLEVHKLGSAHPNFADNRTDRTFSNVLASVMGHRNDSSITVAHPEFVRTLALAVEAKAELLQAPRQFPIAQLTKLRHARPARAARQLSTAILGSTEQY